MQCLFPLFRRITISWLCNTPNLNSTINKVILQFCLKVNLKIGKQYHIKSFLCIIHVHYYIHFFSMKEGDEDLKLYKINTIKNDIIPINRTSAIGSIHWMLHSVGALKSGRLWWTSEKKLSKMLYKYCENSKIIRCAVHGPVNQ